MAILPGARSPLVSEKIRAMTDKDDILTLRFPFYASLKSCVPMYLFVPLCSSLFLFSFFYDGMTKRKDKEDKYKLYRGFSGICCQTRHASFSPAFHRAARGVKTGVLPVRSRAVEIGPRAFSLRVRAGNINAGK
jgi:hypothetical protein